MRSLLSQRVSSEEVEGLVYVWLFVQVPWVYVVWAHENRVLHLTRKGTKTKGKGVEIRKDSLFDTVPASESQQLEPCQQDNLKGNEHKVDDILRKVPPELSHHAFSSVLGGGTRKNSEIKKTRDKV